MSFGGMLRQATAVDVLIGPFVDSTDGDAEEIGLTIAQADVRLSTNGQTAAQKNDATTCAHDADGFYNCELDATDTVTVGQLTLYVHVAGALAVRHDYQVIEEAVYDALYAAAAAGYGTAQTGDSFARLGAPAGASLAADIAAIEAQTDDIGIAGAGLTALATAANLATVDTVVDAIKAVTDLLPDAGALSSLSTAAALATVDANVDAILLDTGTTLQAELDGIQADTEDIQSRLPAALVAGRIDASVGAMAANVMTAAAAAADLTTELQAGLATAAAVATVDGKIDTVDTNVDSILVDTGTDGVVVAAASKTGYSLSSAGIQAIWDALTSALTTASSIGKLLVDNINATISSRLASASYTAPLDAAGTRSAVGLASANLDTQLDALPTAAENATQVRTELTTELGRIDASVSTRATPAQVNAEVLDVLSVDVFSQPSAAPTASSSLKDMLAWLFLLGRNKVTQTSTTQAVRNDADSADVATATVSDDGSQFVRGEWQ